MTAPPDLVHLLLVDDLEENLRALDALLRREGLVLLKARSGPDALELLLQHDVALALLDVQMPGMTGYELAELMRGPERTRRVPIIFLTAGLTDASRRFRGYEAGAVDFLQKPLEPDVLRSKVDVFVELYRQRREIARQRDETAAVARENARLLDQSRRAADALRESERRLTLALEAGQLGFWDWDIPTGRVHFGGCWASMLGYDPAEIEPNLGSWERLVHPDDLARASRAVADHLEGRTEFYDCEHRLRHKDGSWRWILDRGQVVERDAGGRPLRAIGTHADVTARREAEEDRERARALTQSVIDGSTALVFAKDLEGRYFLTNRAWRAFAGISAAQAHGATDEQIFAPEVARTIREDDRRALAAAEPLIVEEPAVIQGRQVTYLSCKFALTDAEGRAYAVCGVSADVTELKRIQAALAARERELQTLADNTPDILARVDRNLRHVFVNASVERATGRSRVDFVGKTNRELGMPPELCDLWDKGLREVFETGQQRSLEFTFPTPAGDRRFIARMVPEAGPGGVVEHVLSVAQDVSERHRYEEALREADRRKDEFLAILAHELRNPLAPIRTGLEILGRAPADDPAAVEARAMMERQLAHMVRLVDDLLDVSRISQGKVKLRRQLLVLRDVIDNAIETCRPILDAAGHRLVVERPDAPVWLDGDPTRLAQVVGNLLNNATKYTPERGRITLSACVEGSTAVIRVADDGIGIAPEMLPRIFDLFTQVERTLDRAGGGLGIGLSLVRMLVEAHGGRIEAQSPGEGRGSTFTIRLPVVAAPAADHAPRPVAAGRPARSSARATTRVLVVDDNEDAANSLARLLKLLGHVARVAHDGPRALEVARDFGPDLILLDLGLPGMDGYQVCRRLRSDPELGSKRLVALTGWGTEEDRRRTSEAGFDGHLVKPVDPDQIQALLATSGESREPTALIPKG